MRRSVSEIMKTSQPPETGNSNGPSGAIHDPDDAARHAPADKEQSASGRGRNSNRQRFIHQRLNGWPLHYTLASTVTALSLACLLSVALGALLLAYNAKIVEVQARY